MILRKLKLLFWSALHYAVKNVTYNSKMLEITDVLCYTMTL